MTRNGNRCQPNLFILGAPKCGTTSVYDYLVQFPTIGGGIHKEPHYFNDDMPEMRQAKTLSHYLSFYDPCAGKELKYIIDASTNYFYSISAPRNIVQFAPSSMHIVLLRNPCELIESLHRHLIFRQVETELDLEKAWHLGPIRNRAPQFVKRHPYPGHLDYRQVGKLGQSVNRILQSVPQSRLLILFLEDLVTDPATTMEQLNRFLGLQPHLGLNLERKNQGKITRWRYIDRLIFYPPAPIRFLKKAIKHTLPKNLIRRFDLMGRISITNQRQPVTLSTQFRQEVIDYLRADIQLLSEITQRDLQPWLQLALSP